MICYEILVDCRRAGTQIRVNFKSPSIYKIPDIFYADASKGTTRTGQKSRSSRPRPQRFGGNAPERPPLVESKELSRRTQATRAHLSLKMKEVETNLVKKLSAAG
jgi:hypothetical protein